ncbi:RNA polymerase sigma factor [Streptomyces canus]|uniref:RNA polymerase sigma factor n=1 Tax=Streptomyces canus TaxID=58343 RepID=UPI00380C8ECB
MIVQERLPDAEAVLERTFAEFVMPEVEVLLRVATTLTARPADAEELVRDTLFHAYRAIDRWDGDQPRVWLLKLMLRAGAAQRRDRAACRPRAGLSPVPTAGTGRQPEPAVVGDAFHEVIDAALEALPLKYRQVVRLVDIDGLSYADAAGLLGVSEETLTGRLHRARKRIRVQLAAAGLVPGRGGR